MSMMFHVTSVLNRGSIQAHGLDVSRMGAAPGIAGSMSPEARGIFVARGQWDVDFFVRMNNTGCPVDVWRVEDVDSDQLLDNGNGFDYVPGTISAGRLTLVQTDLAGNTLPQT